MSDRMLTWGSSVGAIMNGLSRLIIGILIDKFGFKPLFLIILLIQQFNSIAAYFAVQVAPLYFACIIFNYFTLGGIFSVIPTTVTNVFGVKYGPQLYTIIVTGSALTSAINIFNAKFIMPNFGILSVFIMGSIANFLCIIVVLLFKEKTESKESISVVWYDLDDELKPPSKQK